MPLDSQSLEKILIEKFPGAEIRIEDLAGDKDHYRVHIKTAHFQGKSRVQQHQAVFAALRGTAAETIHALSLVTGEIKQG